MTRDARTREPLEALVADSRVIGALSAFVNAPIAAARDARALRLVARWLGLDLAERFRVAAIAMAVAVVTHSVLLAWLGVSTGRIGWSVRGGLTVVAVFVFRQADAFAAAWKDQIGRAHV
mgnify:CR=1 FL=1